jgi:hypothetical protein
MRPISSSSASYSRTAPRRARRLRAERPPSASGPSISPRTPRRRPRALDVALRAPARPSRNRDREVPFRQFAESPPRAAARSGGARALRRSGAMSHGHAVPSGKRNPPANRQRSLKIRSPAFLSACLEPCAKLIQCRQSGRMPANLRIPCPVPILIVDDDPVQRRLLEAAVANSATEAVVADGGEAALRRSTGRAAATSASSSSTSSCRAGRHRRAAARCASAASTCRSSCRPRRAASRRWWAPCATARSISSSSRPRRTAAGRHRQRAEGRGLRR